MTDFDHVHLQQRHSSGIPSPRCLAAIAVDEFMNMYMFGGFDGQNWYNGIDKIDR